MELTRTGRPNEEAFIAWAVEQSQQHAVAVVATNDVCFLNPDDFEAHETRVCINQGRTWTIRVDLGHIVRNSICGVPRNGALFADIPQAIENAIEIGIRCNVQVSLGKYYLPDYPIPENKTPEQYLKDVSLEDSTSDSVPGERFGDACQS